MKDYFTISFQHLFSAISFVKYYPVVSSKIRYIDNFTIFSQKIIGSKYIFGLSFTSFSSATLVVIKSNYFWAKESCRELDNTYSVILRIVYGKLFLKVGIKMISLRVASKWKRTDDWQYGIQANYLNDIPISMIIVGD